MDELLSKIESPRDLARLSLAELEQLAGEMRDVLCNLVSSRTAHFASNLGVVELCLALHTTFDFSRDRLIWDTGHQIYPHKLITGRYHEFGTIRTKGGLMGYPNPHESDYDLFMTGHAGSSVSTALGLKSGDDLIPGQDDRHAVAVIGDGAFPSGIVFEAMNNAGGMKKKLLVDPQRQQDVDLPARRRPGRVSRPAAHEPALHGTEERSAQGAQQGAAARRSGRALLWQVKESIKAGLHGGMLFEELGFRYMGPIDGHNIRPAAQVPGAGQGRRGPVLLHVVTKRGTASSRPPKTRSTSTRPRRSPARPTASCRSRRARRRPTPTSPAERSPTAMRANPRVTVMTAAMCQGNKLEAGPRATSPTASSTPASASRTPWPLPPARPRPGCGRSSTSTARSCSAATTRSSRKSPCRTCRSRSCSIAPG